MIKVRDLSFQYPGMQKRVLDDVNMDIERGDWIMIQGASGCGKTTLALALSGFLFHMTEGDYQGSIEINDKTIEDCSLSDVARKIYLVQQNPENQFCTLTVRDEIAFGLENRNIAPEQISKRVEKALEIVKGEKLLNSNLLELSGGEKQKIAIATAIALKPDVIILDEPTSNLDPIASQEVFQALHHMKELDDITVIIIEHKLQQAGQFATHIFQMVEGKVTEKEPSIEEKSKGITRLTRKINQTRVNWEPLLYLKGFNVQRQDKTVAQVEELMVCPGEFIALMGPNGSGKTSFLLGLLGLLDSTYETGQISGRDIHSLKTYDIARNTGFVFQNPDHQLFCDSIEDELLLGPRNYGMDLKAVEPKIMALMGGFGMQESFDVHPFNLSYGQKKRLNIASVLAYKPKLLLLDEIFIGQDDENIQFTLEMLNEYIEQQQAAVILVNHYIDPLLKLADRLLFMDIGRVLFDTPMKQYRTELKKNNRQEYLPQYCK